MDDRRTVAPDTLYLRCRRAAAQALAAGALPEADRLGRRAWAAARQEQVRHAEPEALCFLATVERRRAAAHVQAGRNDEAQQARGHELQWLREAVSRGEEWLGLAEKADLTDLEFAAARPYVEARFALALALWDRQEVAEAVWHLDELLRLRPSDKVGARYALTGILAQEGADQAVRQVMARYSGDCGGEWAYLRALLVFRLEGDSPRARDALRAALNLSPESARLLRKGTAFDRGAPLATREDPGVVWWILFANTPAWLSTHGAIEWLRKVRRGRGSRAPGALLS